MKLTVAGGCGEHGRNCFFVEGGRTAFLVDCGVMSGAEKPYPRLSDAQIQAAEWLFITHSHLDHTGAYPWLCEHGFSGCAVMTRETAGQLHFSPERLCLLDGLAPAMSSVPLSDRLSVLWGKSGHCAGSIWYILGIEGKHILFSGDYIEDTLIYRCDLIRDAVADLAVLDSAYGGTEQTSADYRGVFVETVNSFLQQGQKILFPVPKYGRSLELMLLLLRHFPDVPITLDKHLQGEISRIRDMGDWLKPEALDALPNMPLIGNRTDSKGNCFVFISDQQLKSQEGQRLACEISDRGGMIILTGNRDTGSFGEKLLASERAVFSRYAVHLSDKERVALAKQNHFTTIVPFHSTQYFATPYTTGRDCITVEIIS